LPPCHGRAPWAGTGPSGLTSVPTISAIFFDNTNDPLLQSNERTLVDAAVTVGHTRSGVSATFAVRNLTDEVVVSDALPITNYGFIQRTFAPPRAFFFTVRAAFQ